MLSRSIPAAGYSLSSGEPTQAIIRMGIIMPCLRSLALTIRGCGITKDIYFSQYGNLKNTMVQLMEKSSSGLTGKEIGALVRLDPRSFLHYFRNAGGIQREKTEGVYVYFSDNPVTYKQRRKSLSELAHPAGEFLSEADAVITFRTDQASWGLLRRNHGLTRNPHAQNFLGCHS